jgi:hypothetical protein
MGLPNPIAEALAFTNIAATRNRRARNPSTMQRTAGLACRQPHWAAAPRRHAGPSASRPAGAARRVAARASLQDLELHFGDTTVSFPLGVEQAAQLAAAVSGVMHTFAEKQKAERPKRWDAMEFKMKGAWDDAMHTPMQRYGAVSVRVLACRPPCTCRRRRLGARLTSSPPAHPPAQGTPRPGSWSTWRSSATPTRTPPPLTPACW